MKNAKKISFLLLLLCLSFLSAARAKAAGGTCAQVKGTWVAHCYKGESAGLSGFWATKCPGNLTACAYRNDLQCGSCPSGEVCCMTDDEQSKATDLTLNSKDQPTPSAGSSGNIPSQDMSGALVPCDTNCTLCHLIIGFKGIYEFFLKLLFVATMLAITVSGVFYMVSAGSKTLTEVAKKAITYALTAFVVGMGAWIIINTIMVGLGYKHPYGGSWWQFTCDTSKASPSGGTGGGGGGSSSSTPNWGGGKQNTGTGDGTCGGIKVAQNSDQCKDTSAQLDDVLKCINGKVAMAESGNNFAGVPGIPKARAAGGVSVMSLGQNQNGGNWKACIGSGWSSANCPHAQNSCHYGGANCQGQINAADLVGDLETIKNKAIECGADTVIYDNTAYFGGNSKSASDHGTHVHVSVNNAACGCDYLKS